MRFFRITQNPYGSVTRLTLLPSLPAIPRLTADSQLTLSKDIPLNATNKTFLCLFCPISMPKTTTRKLPIIIYFDGGGFDFFSATSFPFHKFGSIVSAESQVVVISVEYRLAPKHRLPAYEDAVEAVLWVRDQALGINGCDERLTQAADFSKVCLMGSSAGKNIAYNACLRALDRDLNPIKIVGLVMDQPFFGWVESTESELRLVDDHVLPLSETHLVWSLSLPEGCDRDHKYCNPLQDLGKSRSEKIGMLPKCLIRGYGGDPLVDRQREFATMLETRGVHLITKFDDEGYHGVEMFDRRKVQVLYDDIKSFIWSLVKKQVKFVNNC